MTEKFWALMARSHDKSAKAFSTGEKAQLFYIFLITGNFTTNNALKDSFNAMNLRFNFTSNKSLLINKFIFSKKPRKHVRSCSNARTFVVRSFVRAVGFLQHERTCFLSLLEKINILIRRDLLEVKLNLKFIILRDTFNALLEVKFPVIRNT